MGEGFLVRYAEFKCRMSPVRFSLVRTKGKVLKALAGAVEGESKVLFERRYCTPGPRSKQRMVRVCSATYSKLRGRNDVRLGGGGMARI